MPARGPLGHVRDRAVVAVMNRVFRTGMPALNQARAEFGLAPVRNLADVLNAANRVVRAGAGLRVSKKASAKAIHDALARVLDEPGYRAAARRMAATLAAERDEGLVVDELERAAEKSTGLSHPDPRDPSRR